MTALDLDFIRDQFPAFREPSLAGQRHFENAGGSWACQQTIEALTAFYRTTKLQPYHPHPSAQQGGARNGSGLCPMGRPFERGRE